MYAPAIETLKAGFAAMGATVRIGVLPPDERSLGGAGDGGGKNVKIVPVNLSSIGPGMAWLRAGDAFVWVGPKQHGAAPWARLRAGIRTIYYQTEAPRPGCWVPPNRHPTPVGKRLSAH